ncbi:MAG: tetratricopeptide repeat protein [Acidobacteriota bacterium]
MKIYSCGLLLLFFIFATGSIYSQDLGSSNKLFDPSTPKTTTVKKTAPKSKNSSSKKTIKRAPVRNVAKTAQPKTNSAKTDENKQNAADTTPKQELNKKLVITVEQPQPKNTEKPTPVKNEYNEIFEQAIAEGNAARGEREYSKAEAAYLRAQSLQTKDSRAIYGLGNLYSDQQRWEEAERAYRTAIEFEPTAPESYVALSFVLTQPIRNENLSDRYAEAEKLARQAVKLDAGNAVAYDQLGVALELQGKIADETQNAYKKSIKIDPNFALAYAHLGRLLRRKGFTNESSAAYRTAIQLSTDVPTMILVADVMQSQQKYLESEELLRQALRHDPENPTALYLLGRALTIRASYDEAESVLKKSANVSPNSFVSYVLLSSLYLRREEYNDAEKYLLKALSMVSPNEKKRLSHDFEAIGDGYLKAGKSKDAVRAYRQAINLDTGKAVLADKLAKAQGS